MLETRSITIRNFQYETKEVKHLRKTSLFKKKFLAKKVNKKLKDVIVKIHNIKNYYFYITLLIFYKIEGNKENYLPKGKEKLGNCQPAKSWPGKHGLAPQDSKR